MITWGFVVSYSDLSSTGSYFIPNGSSTPVTASYLQVTGSAGDIVWENAYGKPQYIANAQPGLFYPVGAGRILSSATVNGSVRTTAATNIMWYAGNNAA